VAVAFMPDESEGHGELFRLCVINGNGELHQLALVVLIIVMAIMRCGGDVVMAGLCRHKHRLFEPGQAHGDIALAAYFAQHFVQRPGIAALPKNADMRIAQERLQVPLLLQRGLNRIS